MSAGWIVAVGILAFGSVALALILRQVTEATDALREQVTAFAEVRASVDDARRARRAAAEVREEIARRS